LIGDYYKKKIGARMEAMKEPEYLFPKLRNNEQHHQLKYHHHVAITAPKLSLPGSLSEMYGQTATFTHGFGPTK